MKMAESVALPASLADDHRHFAKLLTSTFVSGASSVAADIARYVTDAATT